MSPDDPRHGTPAGHHAGCRDDCCREARNRYERNRRKAVEVGRSPLWVDATGTRRRIQALMALGWTGATIAATADLTRGQSGIAAILDRQTIHAATRVRVARAYESLSMTLGPSSITRARAAARGWPPPLAWDRIDDPTEKPAGAYRPTLARTSDELLAEVEHLTHGGTSLHEAARQLGVSVGAIERARERAKDRDREDAS